MKHSSAPAYTIGIKYPAEPITTDKLSPGPNRYNIRKEEIIVPSRTFSKGPRSISMPKNMNPGPGSYEIRSFLSLSPPQSTRKPPKHITEKNDSNILDTPGPGSYYPEKPKRVIGYSIGNKTSLAAPTIFEVGPGLYSPNFSSIKPVKSTTIGKSLRTPRVIQEDIPGPGSYNPSDHPEIPTYIFPKDLRNKNHDPNYPAPNHYNIPGFSEEFSSKPGKTILPRRPLPKPTSEVPGPGSYTLILPTTSPAFSLGRSKRAGLSVDFQSKPGPGHYSPINSTHSSPGKSIGTSKREGIAKVNSMPGPGTYESRSFVEDGPKYTMVGKVKEAKGIVALPGPGYYEPNLNAVKAEIPHAIIGAGQRIVENNRGLAKGFPGPGSYDSKGLDKSPSWTFKKGFKEREVAADAPGPGSYCIAASVPDVPKYLLITKSKK